MYRRSCVMSNFDKNTFLPAAVVLIWVAGLSLGVIADRLYGEAYRACLLLTPYQLPDFFGSVSIRLLPLLISAYAVSFCPLLLLGIVLFWGMLTGLGISAVAVLYAGAGGMMSGLLLFGLLLQGPVLLWYWLYGGGGQKFRRDTVCCLGIGIIISWLDQAVVAPLLLEIVTF